MHTSNMCLSGLVVKVECLSHCLQLQHTAPMDPRPCQHWQVSHTVMPRTVTQNERGGGHKARLTVPVGTSVGALVCVFRRKLLVPSHSHSPSTLTYATAGLEWS